jgi:hypothetical protein
MTETFKNLRFQEILLDKHTLFDNYLGSIFGTVSSDYNALGKKIFERISNIVDNNFNINKAEIKSLRSLLESVDYYNNIFSSNDFNYPAEIKRIINLLSIYKSHLFGFKNQFKENFDPKGYITRDTYGINLGERIDTYTYIVTAGVPIVALEKFSNTYTLLNTWQPLSALELEASTDAIQYPLSAYNIYWGWPLILPSNISQTYSIVDDDDEILTEDDEELTTDQDYFTDMADISKYYYFFEFNDIIDGTVFGNTIDFDNILTKNVSVNTPLSSLNSQYGIYENIIANTLYSSLSLFH